MHTDRERRDGEREFRGRDDGDDKTLGDWRRKEESGGRDRRGFSLTYWFSLFVIDKDLRSLHPVSAPWYV